MYTVVQSEQNTLKCSTHCTSLYPHGGDNLENKMEISSQSPNLVY